MSDDVQRPVKGSRRVLKSLWRQVFPKVIDDDDPKPTRRYNSERWPQDEEQGYFCDSLCIALFMRGELHSESTSPRESQCQGEIQAVPAAQREENFEVPASPAMVGESEELGKRGKWLTRGGEPIAVLVYRLVRNHITKRRFKKSDCRTITTHTTPRFQDFQNNDSLEETPEESN